MNEIVSYLEELIPNPVCELNYSKDYELLLAVVLSAQTTDKRVNEVTRVLFDKYRTLNDFASAQTSDIENIIKPIGTYKRKSVYLINIAKKLIEEGYDYIPRDRSLLESLDGVGRKTANVVLSIIYNEPCIAVDTHIKRVSIRLGIADKCDNVNVVEKKLYKIFNNNLSKLHHQLLLFGRYHCKARNPECFNCKLQHICKYEKKY